MGEVSNVDRRGGCGSATVRAFDVRPVAVVGSSIVRVPSTTRRQTGSEEHHADGGKDAGADYHPQSPVAEARLYDQEQRCDGTRHLCCSQHNTHHSPMHFSVPAGARHFLRDLTRGHKTFEDSRQT